MTTKSGAKDKATPPRKGEQRTPWQKWRESKEGQRCAELATLLESSNFSDRELYLENRLWWAFQAGLREGRNER